MADIDQNVTSGAELIEEMTDMGEHGVIGGINKENGYDLAQKINPQCTKEVIDIYQSTRDTMIASTALATGRYGLTEMAKDKDFQQASMEVPLGKDKIGSVFYAKKNLPSGDGGMKEKPGVVSVSYKADGQVGSKGQLKKVKADISERAAELANI